MKLIWLTIAKIWADENPMEEVWETVTEKGTVQNEPSFGIERTSLPERTTPSRAHPVARTAVKTLLYPGASFGPLKPLGPQLAEALLLASKHINLSDRNVVGTGPGTLIFLMASCALC
jgi:hypothetical protein